MIFKLFFEKVSKIPKDIEKNKEICFSFDILRSIRTFQNITTCKMFIFQKFQFEIDL
jgi:hypothetical protein